MANDFLDALTSPLTGDYRKEKPLSVKAADTAVSLATPIDSMVEIQAELEKEEPDYLKIGMLGGIEALSIVGPGIAPAARTMIRKGADMARQPDNVVDVASNVPKVSRQVSNTDYDTRVAALDESEDAVSWQKNAEALVKELRETSPTIRTPELEESAQALRDQRITREQHLENVNTYKPVESWDALPREPSNKATVFSLKPDQREKGRFILPTDTTDALGVTQSGLKVGDRFNGRLDIPAYQRFDTWIVAGTSNAEKGVTHYAKAIHYKGVGDKPVRFAASQKTGEKIGTGEMGKTGYATVSGEIKDLDADAIREKAATLLNDPEWTQVGFDPRRQSSFYVRGENNRHVPVREADEVIQIGPLVLAKNAKLDMEYAGYNEGGMAMDEQMNAVFKSSRTGYAGGGSPKPRNRWEMLKQWWDTEKEEDEDEASAFDRFLESFMGDPIERGMRKKKQGAYKFAEGGEVGAAPDTTIGVDPVSGNEVPMGATPEEVRDDIPAQLSEGEYVVPADVVRFYGVKFFEDLRTEAKQGYAEMDQNGRIGGEPVGPEGMEMIEPEDDLPFDISELQVVDDETGMYEGGLTGYAEGGLELPNAPAATPVPTNPFSITGGTGGFEIREYVNAAGEVMYIQFMNGQPMTFIPEGFRPKGSAAEQVSEEVTEATSNQSSSRRDDDDDDPTIPQQEAKTAVDWNKATTDEFATGIKGLGMSGAFGTIAGGLVGGPIGMAVGIGAKSAARYKAYDMLAGIDYQLESMSSDDPNRALLESQKGKLEEFVYTGDDGKSDDGIIGKSGIFGGKSSMYENLQDTSGDGRVTFQDTWLGDLLGGDGKLGVQGPSLAASRKGARRGEIASVSDKAITAVEKDTGKSVSVSAEARDKSDAGSRVSSASRSASAAQNYGKAATGSKYVLNSDGSTRKVTTYDKDKVKDIGYNPGGR